MIAAGEKIIITGGERQGQTGTIIEVTHPDTVTIPSHLVKFRKNGKGVWQLECNIHPTCRYHPKVEARYRATHNESYKFCNECAKKMKHQLGLEMQELLRYEPMSLIQLEAKHNHLTYIELPQSQHTPDDKLPCTVCCLEQAVNTLAEVTGACLDCVTQGRRVPGWIYPIDKFKEEEPEKTYYTAKNTLRGLEVFYAWSTIQYSVQQFGETFHSIGEARQKFEEVFDHAEYLVFDDWTKKTTILYSIQRSSKI